MTKIIKGYRLDRPLGAGGMGSVYVAEKLATHQPFAVKFMQDHLVADPSYVVRFEREISALRAIRHPNVVDVFEWNLPTPGANESPFVVMELLDGEGLDRLLKRKPVLPAGMAVEIMLQVLDGLAAAHAVGVIHRDLGPSNVFLEPQAGGKFRAKILDFGLARPIGEEGAANVTQEGTLMGKPAYVAPELFGGGALDARSDLFACGIILYRMLTGRFPYREAASQMLWVERYAERDQNKEYPSAKSHNPSIPDSLDAVVSKSIRRIPDERYSSAREMQQAVLAVEEDILDGQQTVLIEPTPARPAGEQGSSTIVGRSAVSLAGPARAQRRWLPIVAAASVVSAAVVVALVILLGGKNDAAPGGPPAAEADVPPAAPVAAPDGAASEKLVHLVVVGAPDGSFVSVGDVRFRGNPPDGHVPQSDAEVEVVVIKSGYEEYHGKVIPDRDKSIPVDMVAIVAPPILDLDADNAGTAPPDAGAAVDVPSAPPARDAGRPPRDTQGSSRRDAGAVAPPRDTGVTAPPLDAGTRPPVDVGGHLPDDPFGGANRLPTDIF
jgi:serine/threonine-protein kinase